MYCCPYLNFMAVSLAFVESTYGQDIGVASLVVHRVAGRELSVVDLCDETVVMMGISVKYQSAAPPKPTTPLLKSPHIAPSK